MREFLDGPWGLVLAALITLALGGVFYAVVSREPTGAIQIPD